MSRIDELIQELCPDGVEFAQLQAVFTTKGGYTPSKNDPTAWADGTVPWFRMEDIRDNGRILGSSLQKINESAVKGGRLFPANSILVATSATIGEHALITVPHLSNQRFTSLTLKPEFVDRFEIKFVFYYCFVLDEWCRSNTTTSSFASVDMSGFKKFRFPVPPLEVQREIVRVLDKFTQLEAELEAELEARRSQYEHYRSKAFHFAGDADVRWSTLGEVSFKVSSGGTPSSGREAYYGGDIPWLRTQEVDFGPVHSTGITITEEGLRNSSAKWIPKHCVIVAMYGATAAKVAINEIPLTTNQACCNLQIDPLQAEYRYVFFWIASQYERLRGLGEGSQSNLNAKKVKDFLIPVPSLEKQREIVALLDKFDALVNDISIGLPGELVARRKQYEHYRDRLLTFKELPA